MRTSRDVLARLEATPEPDPFLDCIEATTIQADAALADRPNLPITSITPNTLDLPIGEAQARLNLATFQCFNLMYAQRTRARNGEFGDQVQAGLVPEGLPPEKWAKRLCSDDVEKVNIPIFIASRKDPARQQLVSFDPRKGLAVTYQNDPAAVGILAGEDGQQAIGFTPTIKDHRLRLAIYVADAVPDLQSAMSIQQLASFNVAFALYATLELLAVSFNKLEWNAYFLYPHIQLLMNQQGGVLFSEMASLLLGDAPEQSDYVRFDGPYAISVQ